LLKIQSGKFTMTASQVTSANQTGAPSDIWNPNYNPDAGDKVGQDFAAALANEIERGGDPGNGLAALLGLNNTPGIKLTDAQRQLRMEQLIHDLGPAGTAKLMAELGFNGAPTQSQALSQNTQFTNLLQSSFSQMINNGSFSQQDAKSLMDSLASQASSPQAWNNTAWFTTNLLGGVQGPNSAAVKIAAAQELINLAQKAPAGSYARTVESAEASDLLGNAAQDPAGYQPVINLLNQLDSQHPGFMKSFASDATLGMMNLSQSNQTLYSTLGNATAFQGMANLLNTLTGDSPTKTLAIEAFDGITSAIASNPSQASGLLNEENVLPYQSGLRDALANTFAKYTPEVLAAWSGAPGTHEVPNTYMQDRLMSFMGFELSPLGSSADANSAVDSIMNGVSRFTNYALGKGDPGIDAFFRAGLSGPEKQKDAAYYAGMILGSALNVSADAQAFLNGHYGSPPDVSAIQWRIVWDWARTIVDAGTTAGGVAVLASGNIPASFLGWMQTLRSFVSVPGDINAIQSDSELLAALQSGNTAYIPALNAPAFRKFIAAQGAAFNLAESMFNPLVDSLPLTPDVASAIEGRFLDGVNAMGGTPQNVVANAVDPQTWINSFYGGWNGSSIYDFSANSRYYGQSELITLPG
jgi:hypothetical protein